MTFLITPNIRRVKVFSKTDGKCYYCGCALCYQTFHIDHIEPKSRGGTNLQENLAPACPSCNTSKGQRTIDEWRLFKAFKLQNPDAPDMSLKQIQWLTENNHLSVQPIFFEFEVQA